MVLIERNVFFDVVGRVMVHRYRERLTGRVVLATGAWAMFRCETDVK